MFHSGRPAWASIHVCVYELCMWLGVFSTFWSEGNWLGFLVCGRRYCRTFFWERWWQPLWAKIKGNAAALLFAEGSETSLRGQMCRRLWSQNLKCTEKPWMEPGAHELIGVCPNAFHTRVSGPNKDAQWGMIIPFTYYFNVTFIFEWINLSIV